MDDTILYRNKPPEPTRKSLVLINEFSQVAGCKIKTSVLVVFLHTSTEQSNGEIKKATPFTMTSKKENMHI